METNKYAKNFKNRARFSEAYLNGLIDQKRLILPEGFVLNQLYHPLTRFYFRGLDLYPPQEPFVTVLPVSLKAQEYLQCGRTFDEAHQTNRVAPY